MKPVNLKKVFFLPILLSLLILLGVFAFSTYYAKHQEIQEEMARHLEETQDALDNRLASEAKTIAAAINMLSKYQPIQAAWSLKNREALLQIASPFMVKLDEIYGITHFYFHDLDGINFLRVHKPEMHGDVIERFTMREAQKTGQLSSGLELGPLGTLTCRVVLPWTINDQLVGYIEMGTEIDHLLSEIKSIVGEEFYLAIYKDLLVRKQWEAGMRMLGREGNWDQFPSAVIISQTLEVIPKIIGDFLSAEDHVPMETAIGLETHIEGKTYQGGFVPFYDASGDEVGDIVVMYDVTSKTVSAHKHILMIGIICVVVGVLIVIFFWIILGKLELELNEHRYHLNELVEKRTAEIVEVNTQLEQEVSERKQAEEKLQVHQDQLRALASELSLTEERERRQIATELHDSIGQTLAISKIKLGDILNVSSAVDFAEQLEAIMELIEQTIHYTKTLIFELSPPMLYELDFESALEWLTEQIHEQHGVYCSFEDDEKPKPLDDEIRMFMFKAVRELLINAIKHAQSSHIKVSVCKDDGCIRVRVEDDGVGFDASQIGHHISGSRGFGLFNIIERLDYYSGRLEIESQPNHGTRASLVVPLKSHHDSEISK